MNIAFIAHDTKKELLVEFCLAYSGVFAKHNLFATSTTGNKIISNTGLKISLFLPGSQGGVQQIGSMVGCDQMDMVILFRDPTGAESNRNDEIAMIKLCDVHSVPIATNIATAEMLIHGLERGDLDWRKK